MSICTCLFRRDTFNFKSTYIILVWLLFVCCGEKQGGQDNPRQKQESKDEPGQDKDTKGKDGPPTKNEKPLVPPIQNIDKEESEEGSEKPPSVHSQGGNNDDNPQEDPPKTPFEEEMEKHVTPLSVGFHPQVVNTHEQVAYLEGELIREQRQAKAEYDNLPSRMKVLFSRSKINLKAEKQRYEEFSTLLDREEKVLDDIHKLNNEINSLYSHYITSPVKDDEMFYKHLISYRKLIGSMNVLEMTQSDLRAYRLNRIEDRRTSLEDAEVRNKNEKKNLKMMRENLHTKLTTEDWKMIYGLETGLPLYLDIAEGYYKNNQYLIEKRHENISKEKINQLEIALLIWIGAWAKHTKDPKVKQEHINKLVEYAEAIKLAFRED